MDEAVAVLQRHRSVTISALRSDVETRYVVERALHLAIQNVLDIGSHVLAASGSVPPEEYTGIISGLADLGVIPAAFAKRIAKMPGLRNLLVHEYVRTNPAKLRTVLRTHVGDFAHFSEYLESWLAGR